MSMAQQEVLKSIYEFLEVLENASGPRVKSWTCNTLYNSLQWAQYCQEVFQKSLGKPYRDELDHKICMMGKLPWAVGFVEIKLDTLQYAERLLMKRLLQNSHVPKELYRAVIKVYLQQPDLFKEDLTEVITKVQEIKFLQRICDAVPSVVSTNLREALADLWLHFTVHVLALTGPRKVRSEELLRQKMSVFATTTSALSVLLALTVLPKSNIQEVAGQEFVLNWIIQLKHLGGLVLQCEPDLVYNVGNRYFVFYQYYIRELMAGIAHLQKQDSIQATVKAKCIKSVLSRLCSGKSHISHTTRALVKLRLKTDLCLLNLMLTPGSTSS